jgi:PAS domain S-box-containing protein
MTERLYERIVEQAADALIFSDAQGVIRVWNRGAESLFGYVADEVLGRSLDIIIPERLRSAHWAGFRKAMETGQAKYAGRVLTTRASHKDSRRLYVDLSFALLKDAAGSILGVLAIGRDSTETYLANRALRARVDELESCRDGPRED